MRYAYPEQDEMVVAFLEHWEHAQRTGAVDVGRAWYTRERAWCRRLAREHGIGLGRVAGIAAALSPRVDWHVAKRMAVNVVRTGEPGEGCLSLSSARAQRIWLGERPLRVLSGEKTRAFYRALLGNTGQAVIDTWMLKAVNWPNPWGVTARQYARIAGALCEAARRVDEDVAPFQATVWAEVRGR